MINTVYRTLCEKCGFEGNENIIVALSGGADSVTLFDVLVKIREEYGGFRLFAAHINHNLRGDESQRDEDFVRNLCEKAGVELFVLSCDVGTLAKEKGQSIELCAREVRYDFFEKLSKKLCAKVATAHTLSDSEETMLYNICRGTSLHGLCSIPYKRDYIVRPLLDVTRCQIEEYCESNKLSFVQDSTNFCEDVCKRNKLRLSVIPQLKNINEGFDNNFFRLRENLLLADDYMTMQAEDALKESELQFGFDAKKLCSYHPAVLGYALTLLLREAGAQPDGARVMLCQKILENSGAVEIASGLFAVCKQSVFRIVNRENTEDFTIPFKKNTEFVFNGKKYTAELINKNSNVYRKLSSFCIGCDKINHSTVIRTRESGDTFTPLYRGVTKPLRKLQNELKIPSEKRDEALVVANGHTVLWTEYIGVSLQGAMNKEDENGIFIKTEVL